MRRREPTNGDADATLSPQQCAAIDQLALGRTLTDVASSVGVSRQTVSTWLNRSTDFRTALAARRVLVWESAADRLRGLLSRSLDVLERELELGSLGAATVVLRAAGLHGLGPPPEASTPESSPGSVRRSATARSVREFLLS